MTATNHAVTGAIIGLMLPHPLVAVPVAFLSHYALDAVPHYTPNMPEAELFKSGLFARMLITDAVLCVSLVGTLAWLHPAYWLLASACAFVATLPDFFWINRFVKVKSGKSWRPSLLNRFADRIQWFQRPIGAVVEVAWLVGGVTLLVALVR